MRAFLLLLSLYQQPLQEAVTLVREGRFEEAAKKLEGQPEPAELKTRIAYFRLRAAIDSGLGHYDAAARSMQIALALAPADEQLKAATAYALIEAGNAQDATHVLAGSQSPQSLTILGIARYAQGEFNDAEQSLEQAIERDSHYNPAYRSLAQIALESSGAPRKETVSALCRWDATVCNALRLRSTRAAGDTVGFARAMIELEKSPQNDGVARCALGQGYSWRKQWSDARRELESCVRLQPTPQNHYRLATVYRQLGDEAHARAELDRRARLLGSQSEGAASGRMALRDLPH